MQLRDLRLGARVVVQKNKAGTVRFLGRTKFAKDDWVGIELDHACGKHDGMVEGVRYFQCARANTGVFVRALDVEPEPGSEQTHYNLLGRASPMRSASASSPRPHGSGPTSPAHGRVASTGENMGAGVASSADGQVVSPRPSRIPAPNGAALLRGGQHRSRPSNSSVGSGLGSVAGGAMSDSDGDGGLSTAPEDDPDVDEGAADDLEYDEVEEGDAPGRIDSPDGGRRSTQSRGRSRGHYRSSSDLARQELSALLSQPSSAFLKNKSGIVRELNQRLARRPSTLDMVKSGIIDDNKVRRSAAHAAAAAAANAAGLGNSRDRSGATGSVGAAGWALGSTGSGPAPQGPSAPFARRLYVFGENAHGELSTGDEVDCFVPTEIRLPPPPSSKSRAGKGNTPGAPGTPSSSLAASAAASSMGTSLGTSDFAQVCLGLHHMVVLTWNNEVLSCGSWVANLLGTDDRANLKQLKRLKQFEALRAAHPDNPIISIGCGDRHTVALHQDGACESFGGTLYGKLGHRSSGADDGTTTGAGSDASTPGAYTSIAGLQGQRVSQMDAGNWHTACCTIDGAVFTFGGGGRFYNHGQLGHGDLEDTMIPRRVERFGHLPSSRVRVAAICCGGYHTLALTQERLVYSWGSSKFGQLGLGSDTDETTPQLVTGLLTGDGGAGGGDGSMPSGRTIGLAAGENHSLAVQADGSLYSWGFGLQGQCGHGISANEKSPRRVAFFAARNICIVQVDAGWRHSIVLSDTHSVYTFGHGDKGQLGLGDTRSHSLPQLVESLEGLDIKTVAAGGSHSLAFNDFFKAAQELVFLQQVRAFKEVKTSGSSVRVSDAARAAAEARAAREAARQRRLGYSASPSPALSRRTSPSPGRGGGGGSGAGTSPGSTVPSSPSRADFGLGSPNPLVPLELKALLREVDPRDEREEQLQRERRERDEADEDDSDDSDGDGTHDEQDEVDALREAQQDPAQSKGRGRGRGHSRGTSAGSGEEGSDMDDSAQQQKQKQRPRPGARGNLDAADPSGANDLFDDEKSYDDLDSVAARPRQNRRGEQEEEEEEDHYTPERRYVDESEEEFAARRAANAAKRLRAKTAAKAKQLAMAGPDPAAAAAAAATLAAANAAAAAAALAQSAADAALAASLHIELVYSSSVVYTHRFVTFATRTPPALVHSMLDGYVSGPHGKGRLYKQVLVTPGNTVAREVEQRLEAEAEAAQQYQLQQQQQQQQSALSSTHLRHTYTYSSEGPPRYTLLLILRGGAGGASLSGGVASSDPSRVSGSDLWPPWASDLHRLLRSTCADVAPGMDSRMNDEERAAADPAQPCFRELRPLLPTMAPPASSSA